MIVFPWPPKDLSPNAHVYWARKAKAAKSYRRTCFYLAKQAKATAPAEGPIALRVEFVQPDRRGRDLDNMLASIKPGLDALAEAMGVNDKRFTLQISVADEIGGMVRVSL